MSKKEKLDNYAQINQQDSKGRTALHHAAESGHLELVRILLEAKLDPNLADKNGITPFELAYWNDHDETLKLLIRYFNYQNGC